MTGNRSTNWCFIYQVSDYAPERCFCYWFCYGWQKPCSKLWSLSGIELISYHNWLFFLTVIKRVQFYANIISLTPPFQYSSLHLALSWNGTGRYSHMSRRNFGPLTVHIDQMKELQHSVGCKAHINCSSLSLWNHLDINGLSFAGVAIFLIMLVLS